MYRRNGNIVHPQKYALPFRPKDIAINAREQDLFGHSYCIKIGTLTLDRRTESRTPRSSEMLKKAISLKIDSYLSGLIISLFLFFPCPTFARDFNNGTEFFHRVLPGESLSEIARLYLPLTEAYTVRDLIRKIQERNGLNGTMIRSNQCLLIPLVRSSPVVSQTVPKRRDFEAKGIYVNRYSMACRKMTRLINALIALGGNTVILDGKDMSGRLSYPSRVDLAREIGASTTPSISDPVKLFHDLHEKGIHVGIRIVLFYDPLLASKRPDLAVRSITTGDPWTENGKQAWVDPYQPTVQRYNLEIARELAEMGVDEIQFDYIRFPAMGNTRDVGYSFDEHVISKHKIITDFLAQAHRELAPYKVLLSVDVFGVMGWSRPEDIQITGQKIEDLARHCDVISPMIYPSHFYGPFESITNPGDHPFFFVSETCRRFSALLEGKEVTIRPWIQAFPFGTSTFSEEYILEELRALSQSETIGWLFWSAGNAYDVAWKALAQWNNGDLKQEGIETQFSLLDEALME